MNLIAIGLGLIAPNQGAANDPLHVTNAPVTVELRAGQDGLRNDSRFIVDVVMSDGTVNRAIFAHGCPDNGLVRFRLPHKWTGPHARIALINATLTGKRGGTESADDFDIKSLRVMVDTATGGHLAMFTNTNINTRLHGVGSWTTGFVDAFEPKSIVQASRFVDADISVGELRIPGRILQLGLTINGEVVWGSAGRAEGAPLGYAHVVFNFDHPISYEKITQIQLRQMPPGDAGFFANGITVTSHPVPVQGVPRVILLGQAMNINLPINHESSWKFDGVRILPPDPENRAKG